MLTRGRRFDVRVGLHEYILDATPVCPVCDKNTVERDAIAR